MMIKTEEMPASEVQECKHHVKQSKKSPSHVGTTTETSVGSQACNLPPLGQRLLLASPLSGQIWLLTAFFPAALLPDQQVGDNAHAFHRPRMLQHLLSWGDHIPAAQSRNRALQGQESAASCC